MDKWKYFERIGFFEKEPKANLQTLKSLQKLHLLSIPFENLDIHRKKNIVLNQECFYKKIVEQKRGGFCYELNGLFHKLLTDIGFQCKIISARVSQGNGNFGAEYDHLAILTKIEDKEFLVDVGFGDFCAEPLTFVLDEEQEDRNGTFVIRKFDENYYEVLKKTDDTLQSEYMFQNLERNLTEFSGMCKFHQTSSNSHFTKGKLISLMTDNGRQTLTDKKFLVTENEKKNEFEITDDEDFYQILEKEFGIEFSKSEL